MKQSIYQQKLRQKNKKQALYLYKQGLSLRRISNILGTRSHETIRRWIMELSTGRDLTKKDRGI